MLKLLVPVCFPCLLNPLRTPGYGVNANSRNDASAVFCKPLLDLNFKHIYLLL